MSSLALSLLLSAGLLATLSACGDGEAAPGTASSENTLVAQAETPQEVGEAIKAVYVDAIQQTAALLTDRPPAEEVEPRMRALHDATVEQLVALGHKREAMSAADRAVVDRPVKLISIDADFMEAFQVYSQAERAYAAQPGAPGYDLYQMIRGMNIITQYAFFELLREQEPAEAQRLGV